MAGCSATRTGQIAQRPSGLLIQNNKEVPEPGFVACRLPPEGESRAAISHCTCRRNSVNWMSCNPGRLQDRFVRGEGQPCLRGGWFSEKVRRTPARFSSTPTVPPHNSDPAPEPRDSLAFPASSVPALRDSLPRWGRQPTCQSDELAQSHRIGHPLGGFPSTSPSKMNAASFCFAD